jgi:hypothetical protein
MGTDWRDNDPVVEPVVEIYQGDRQNYEMPDASAFEFGEGFDRQLAAQGIREPGAGKRDISWVSRPVPIISRRT